MKYDITALGELLIDFTPRGKSDSSNPIFEANPGGAPPNVLAQAARLGKKTSFIGKVGTDAFGEMLKNTLIKAGISTQGLKESDKEFTTLAFLTLTDDGERSFSFARNNSADTMLEESDVDPEQIINSRILHIGTLSLTHDSARKATLKALDTAKANGVLVSVDPNLRLALWESEEKAKSAMGLALGYADIIKISDYEVEFLTGVGLEEGAMTLYNRYSPKAMFVTCGKNGALAITSSGIVRHGGFKAETVDTTGAGDSFCGAALSRLIDLDLDFDSLDGEKYLELLKYANAAASTSTTKYGGISSMPGEDEFSCLIMKNEERLR